MEGGRTVQTSLLCLCVALLSGGSEAARPRPGAQITRPELKSISAPAYVAGGGIQLKERAEIREIIGGRLAREIVLEPRP